MREFEVKRIGTKFDLIVPLDLTMVPQAHVLENPIVVPNAKDAFPGESR